MASIVVHRMTRDRYGDRVETASHVIHECMFAPGDGTESNERSDTTSSEATLYAPPDADIRATDVIELSNGTKWEVTGNPQYWADPWSDQLPGGTVVNLNRTRG